MMRALLRTFLPALLTLPLSAQDEQTRESLVQQGPFVGHVTPTTAKVWARMSQPGEYILKVSTLETGCEAWAKAELHNDLCVAFEVKGLQPGQRYMYAIETSDERSACDGAGLTLRTPGAPDKDGSVRLMFGSCCHEDEGTGNTWRSVQKEKPDVVILLGDTPYIDNTQLRQQRIRYAAFAGFAPMAELLRSTPWYGTWDDHDFGVNDTDGRVPGKSTSRQVFLEYHANPSYGDGQRGIYCKFRRGPVEVFLLDTRTFAAMEPSPFKPHHASLLGKKQWQWLFDGLKKSTAPIKVLACGMIWNEATRPGKLDHWGSYPHERDALFKRIGAMKVGGVVLVGGDIHRSRVIRHATKDRAGYDIVELITSPMHHSIIKAANAPHPGLIKDMGEPHTFLMLDVTQRGGKATKARARFVNDESTEHFAIDLLQGMPK